MRNKKLLIPGLALVFLLGTGAITAEAASHPTKPTQEMRAKLQQELATRLSMAVTAGQLTQAQADLIKAKAAELKATMESEREAMQSLSHKEIKAKMKEKRAALESWASANGIPKNLFHLIGDKGPHHGFKGGPRYQ